MQINSLSTGYADTTGLTKLLGGSDSTTTKKSGRTGDASSTGQVSTETIRNIVNQYDLTNITPKQLSEMLQSLHDAGALTDQQFQDLSQIRTDLDSKGIESDEPINLLEHYSQQLQTMQKQLQEASEDPNAAAPAPETVNTVTRWYSWLQKIATVQSSSDMASVDALV